MQAHGFKGGSGESLHPALSPQALALGLADAVWLQDVRIRSGDDSKLRRSLRQELSRLHEVARLVLPAAEQEVSRAEYSRTATAVVGITREALRYDRNGEQLVGLREQVARMTSELLGMLSRIEAERGVG